MQSERMDRTVGERQKNSIFNPDVWAGRLAGNGKIGKYNNITELSFWQFYFFRKFMKKYSKKEAIAVIQTSAKAYEDKLRSRQFLIAYKEGMDVSFSIIGFGAQHFKHFCGVSSKLSAVKFYENALEGRLSENDISFNSNGTTFQKLNVLPALSRMFYGNALRGDFNRSGLMIDADYFVGQIAVRIAVAFRRGSRYDYPVSLYCEDIRKITERTTKVLAIWRRNFGETDFVENTYASSDVDPALLLSMFKESCAEG